VNYSIITASENSYSVTGLAGERSIKKSVLVVCILCMRIIEK